MRKLYVKRERTLACFALTYHCVLGQTVEEHLAWAETRDRAALMLDRGRGALRNGETVCLEIGEEAVLLFVIAYQERGALTTEAVTLPAGDRELRYTVTTEFDGDHRLALRLREAERGEA